MKESHVWFSAKKRSTGAMRPTSCGPTKETLFSISPSPESTSAYFASSMEEKSNCSGLRANKKTSPVFPMGSFFILAIKLSAKKSDHPAEEAELALVRFYNRSQSRIRETRDDSPPHSFSY